MAEYYISIKRPSRLHRGHLSKKYKQGGDAGRRMYIEPSKVNFLLRGKRLVCQTVSYLSCMRGENENVKKIDFQA